MAAATKNQMYPLTFDCSAALGSLSRLMRARTITGMTRPAIVIGTSSQFSVQTPVTTVPM